MFKIAIITENYKISSTPPAKTHKCKLGFADKVLSGDFSVSRRFLNYRPFRKHLTMRDDSPLEDRTPKPQRHSPLQIEIRFRS